MPKKCKKCGVPLEGFGYKWIASKLFGVRPSEKDPGLCNKCEGGEENKPPCCCGGHKVLILFLVLSSMLAAGGECSAGEIASRDALSVIHSRKSVRAYTGEAVAKEDLETLMKAGMAAPTARDIRPWRFVAVTDKPTLEKLAAGLPYTKMIVKAGACIVVCGDTSKALTGAERDFWVQDCSAASENILLAAEALGLGAVWSGMYPLPERVKFVSEVLGLPGHIIPLNVIAVGHPAGVEKPKDKFDQSNIHWDKW